MTHPKYRAWSGAIGHMLFDFGIANLSLVGYLFKEWQNMSLMISILNSPMKLHHFHEKMCGARAINNFLRYLYRYMVILKIFYQY